jgi:Ni/Co efflux regulator RcnB
MKKLLTGAMVALMATTSLSTVVQAQPRHRGDHHDRYDRDHDRRDHDRRHHRRDNDRHGRWDNDRGRHNGWRAEWRRGHRMDRAYWSRAERVDWRRHRLRAPPRGYEWRYVDGRYVLAAVATGLIASIIISSRRY